MGEGRPHKRADPVEVVYGRNPVRELIRRHPYTRKDYFEVHLNEFGAASLNVLVYMFFQTPDWSTELRERQRRPVRIEDLPDANIFLVNGKLIGPFLEGQAIDLFSSVENAVDQNVVQLEIGAQLRLVKVELGLPHLFRVEVPVP